MGVSLTLGSLAPTPPEALGLVRREFRRYKSFVFFEPERRCPHSTVVWDVETEHEGSTLAHISTTRTHMHYGHGIMLPWYSSQASRRVAPHLLTSSLEALELRRVHLLLAVEGSRAVQAERADHDEPRLDCSARRVGLVRTRARAREGRKHVIVDQVPHAHPEREPDKDGEEGARAPRQSKGRRPKVPSLQLRVGRRLLRGFRPGVVADQGVCSTTEAVAHPDGLQHLLVVQGSCAQEACQHRQSAVRPDSLVSLDAHGTVSLTHKVLWVHCVGGPVRPNKIMQTLPYHVSGMM